MTREEAVAALCQPVVEAMGYEWVGVEYHHNSRNAILRIYVDKPEGGIGMDDVVAVTEQINPMLDVEEPIKAAYTLEVSSPGLDRPLFTLPQFGRFIGHEVKIGVYHAIEGQRKFTGQIVAVDESAQTVSLLFAKSRDEKVITIAFDNIDKARLVPVFED